MARRLGVAFFIILSAMGCAHSAKLAARVPASETRMRFQLAQGAQNFGSIPWPDNLYLDKTGRISMGQLANEEKYKPGVADELRQNMHDLDGFSPIAPSFYYIDGEIDPHSLPQNPASSVSLASSAFLAEVGINSINPIPIQVSWNPLSHQLALKPHDGYPLREKHLYVSVITTALRSASSTAVKPSAQFESIRDCPFRPKDFLQARAYDEYKPILEQLEKAGVRPGSIAAMAVFRVQTISQELDEARKIIHLGRPPVAELVEALKGSELEKRLGKPEQEGLGLNLPDAPLEMQIRGGVSHHNMGWMIHGKFRGRSFILDSDSERKIWSRDEKGRLKVRSQDVIWFTLWLPKKYDGPLPLILAMHGSPNDRSIWIPLAEVATGSGYAVLAIDGPLYGMRARIEPADWRNRFTGENIPDFFGDRVQPEPESVDVARDAFATTDPRHPEMPRHVRPAGMRDVIRQTVVDLMTAVRLIREGDWSAVRRADPELAHLRFASPVNYIGQSVGAEVGGIFSAVEPEIGPVVVSGQCANRIYQAWLRRPLHSIGDVFAEQLGMDSANFKLAAYDKIQWYPELAPFQLIADRAEVLAFAPRFLERAHDFLSVMIKDDEVCHNVGTESFARAVHAVALGDHPRYTDLAFEQNSVKGNVMGVNGKKATRALVIFSGANHELVFRRQDKILWRHPLDPPLEKLKTPRFILNPVRSALNQIVEFYDSARSGVPEVRAPRGSEP